MKFALLIGTLGLGMLAGPVRGSAQTLDGKNWLKNASFEEEGGGQPVGWRQERWGGDPVYEYATVGHTGKRCLAIASDKGADAGWGCTVAVEPYARYRLSGWIKTKGVQGSGKGALLNPHNIQPVATPAVTGTADWTRVEVTFETKDQDALQINCCFGGWGLATGKAWYDDLQLEQISKSEMPAPRIRIDAAKTGAPLSKYVYGQFIEHLGRCIYGGIWAEMLEDRKFYYPVGAPESPWKAVGPAEAVSMLHEGAFVGAQTPRVELAGDGAARGVVQAGLGLVKGKAYVGRIWLAGTADAGPVQVSLVWGPGANDRQAVRVEKLTETFTRTALQFTPAADADDGRLEISAAGKGSLRIGTVSLMPADNVHGMRADTLALLKELDAPVYRWPGGNFVSGYDWKDGLGDPDRRPPRKNPAWAGIEHNDFGIDEFLAFCRVLNTEPYITVNSGLGDVQMATDEVEYANGAPDSAMGKLRAANGHREPYAVKYWSIGNEMYGGWQLGHMPLEKYVEKHNVFASAMRKVDPAVQLVAVGAVGPWSEGMLRGSADHMTYISEHFYCGERPGLNGHVRQIPDSVRNIAEAHGKYRQQFDTLKGKDIRIALDEWNYWYGPELFGQIGTRYFLKDALGIAAGLHEFTRHSDLYFMANYAQTVNVIGCIKTNKTAAAFETTGLVLKLYRAHFGTVPVPTEATALLDAQAAWSADKRTFTVGVVNPTMKELDVALEVAGVKLSGSGKRWQIAGRDPQAFNDPGRPPVIQIEESAEPEWAGRVHVAPCSVTLFAFPASADGQMAAAPRSAGE